MKKERVFHGFTSDPKTKKIYNIWCDIKRKCYKEKTRTESYKTKGIQIQESWKEDSIAFVKYILTLDNFDMSKSLDRINTNGNYEEGNLRWATAKEQAHNRSMQSNNTSGVTGVKFRTVRKNTYATAIVRDLEGKQYSKNFSVIQFGLIPAFKMAVDWRENEIAKLNELGAGYSKEHGRKVVLSWTEVDLLTSKLKPQD